MSRFILSLPALALLAGGCSDSEQDRSQAYHQSSSSAKPVVSIIPVVDNTHNDYSWNLSDELSCSIYTRIAQKDRIIVNKSSQVRNKAKNITERQNPFGADLSWMKKIFQDEQFVAFLELVEHEEVPQQNRKKPTDPQKCSANLNMSMRVRVLDMRGQEPAIVLQEIVHDSHFIPRPFTEGNFFQVSWGDDCFNISPVGLAHADFTKEIASRIESYILTASKQ